MIAPPLPPLSVALRGAKLAQSQTPPEQAANGPTPSQTVSILYTRQQAEIPMAPIMLHLQSQVQVQV
jgi:hypothetical protein